MGFHKVEGPTLKYVRNAVISLLLWFYQSFVQRSVDAVKPITGLLINIYCVVADDAN